MLGELMSFRRRSAPAPSDNGNDNAPAFPLYLLPSLRIPFRRHQGSEPDGHPSRPAPASDPPSLSSSPTSPTALDPPATPTTGPSRLLRAHPDTLRCSSCSADLAFHAQIISKGFMGRHGRAYLVSPRRDPGWLASGPGSLPGSAATATAAAATTHATSRRRRRATTHGQPADADAAAADLLNIRVGKPEGRRLATGPHVVADISCAVCGAVVGWKYVNAGDPSQQYKVGKFILETRRVVGFHGWEDVDVTCGAEGLPGSDGGEAYGWITSRRDDRVERGEGEEEEAQEEELHEDEDEEVVVFDSEDEDECDDIFAGVWDAKVVARRRKERARHLMAVGQLA